MLTADAEPGRRPIFLLMLAREVEHDCGHPHMRQNVV